MRKTRTSPARILRIFLIVFLVWVALASFDIVFHLPAPGASSVANLDEASYRVSGTAARARISGEHQQLTLSNLEIDEQGYGDRVLVFAPLFPEFDYGDRVTVRCDLSKPEPLEGFAYDRFLAAKGVYKTCYTNSAPLFLSGGNGDPVKIRLWSFRKHVIQRIDRALGEPHGSLLAGLLLGEQRFSEGWQDIFIATGTSHVVAASGYNVTIVVFLLFGVLTRLGVKRQYAFPILLAGIAGYVILAGAEAAVLRAGVMAAIVLLARQLGRKADMLNAILLTAAVMLFMNPHLLRDDVGFQLSMLSTIALIYFAPVLDEKLKFIPEDYGIRESLSATLAATLFSLPVIFLSFGRLSLVGPIANLLILPLVPYAMGFGALAIAVGFISEAASFIVAGPAWALLSIILFIVKSLSSLPIASIEFPEAWKIPAAIISSALILLLCRNTVRKSKR